MVGGGDLAIWVPIKWLVFLSSSSSLRKKKGRIIYPSRNVVVAAILGPDNPVQVLPEYSSLTKIIWPKILPLSLKHTRPSP
jgi:hypothetical protein